jgi:hypothetical protein
VGFEQLAQAKQRIYEPSQLRQETEKYVNMPFLTLLLWCFRCATKSVNVSFLFVVGALGSFSRAMLCVGSAIAFYTDQAGKMMTVG